MADGVLVVRASGASAARAALEAAGGRPSVDTLQLIMDCPVPRRFLTTTSTEFPGCTVEIRPADDDADQNGHGVVLLTIAAARLSIDVAELQLLMFQPVPVARPLVVLFSSSIGQLLAADGRTDIFDRHGIGHCLIGLAELVLRSALRSQLQQADTAATRYRDAITYIKRNLTDPGLTAERIAEALFISRRRLYQLLDDGEGISGRIRRMRIERAKELLSDPTHARCGIGELSRQCGFVNSAHFSRTFRKIVGQTPREFRDRCLGAAAGSAGEIDRGDQTTERPG